MPKYYCDYCDIFLTHDSSSVRKAHNAGRNHLINVKTYYSELSQDSTQSVIDTIQKAYADAGVAMLPQYQGYPQPAPYNPYARPPMFPGAGPPRPPMFMPRPGGPPPMPPMVPGQFPPRPPAGFPMPPPGAPGAPFPPPGFAPPPGGQFAIPPPGHFAPPGFRPPPGAPFPPPGAVPGAPPALHAPPPSGPHGVPGPGPVMNSDRKRRLEEERD
ncbi:hypothetical protein CPB97_011548 [Podila verticillata]|nr:hypothetical protein CPB97_011548 [Podila verticillata]